MRQADTAEAFAELVKSQRRAPDAGSKMRPEDFTKTRNSVLAGCGVGKDLIQTYVPDASKSLAM